MPRAPKPADDRPLRNATITLPKALYVAARKAAAEQDMSLSAWVSDLVAKNVGARSSDGRTPGQRLARAALERGGLRNRRPLETDPTRLMGDPER